MPSNFTYVLGRKRATAKIVTKLLNYEQMQRRMDIAQDMLTTFNDDPDLLKLLTKHGCMAMTLKPKPNYPNGKRVATIAETKEKNRNRCCWRYQRAHFRSVSGIGKNAGISKLYLRSVTLKETKEILTNKVNTF